LRRWGGLLAVAIDVLAGGAIGAWHGFWVAYRGVPAFVVTLAGLLVFRGAAYLVTDGATVSALRDDYVRLGGGADGSIGAAASWAVGRAALAVVALAQWRGGGRRPHDIALRPGWAEAVRFAAVATLVLGFVAIANAYTCRVRTWRAAFPRRCWSCSRASPGCSPVRGSGRSPRRWARSPSCP
jgi:D-xylose transport system permease protein